MNFSLDKDERLSLSVWLEKHDKSCPYYDDGSSIESKTGAIGGRLTYQFTPTGLGYVTVVRCACGEEINVTNFDLW